MRGRAADHANAKCHSPDDTDRPTDTPSYSGTHVYHQAPDFAWRRRRRSGKGRALAAAIAGVILPGQGPISSEGAGGVRYASRRAASPEGLYGWTVVVLPPADRDGRPGEGRIRV